MAQTGTTNSAREASLARRRAMTSKGKAALAGTTNGTTAGKTGSGNSGSSPAASASAPGVPARKASRARREAMSTNGKAGINSSDRTRQASEQSHASSTVSARNEDSCGCGCKGRKNSESDAQTVNETTTETRKARPARRVQARVGKNIASSTSRSASKARREAMSSRGKAGINGGSSSAQTARAANPHLSSRELAKLMRDQQSNNGKSRDKKSRPCGRMRPNGKDKSADGYQKVGTSETAHGQTLTGTMVGRSQKVTGDEPSTCRDVTGTDYMGADIFREFCQAEPGKTPRKVEVTSTSHGNSVSGNRIGRGSNVTGDEPGSNKRVTGDQYVGNGQANETGGGKSEAGPGKITSAATRGGKTLTGNNVGRSSKVTGDEAGADRELSGSQYMQTGNGNGKAPGKVGISKTLRGGSVSGTMVGRNQRVTGDEPGSCRNVTGDDYIGQEQYSGFCNKTPKPQDRKSGVSSTLTGNAVTGTLTGRSGKVTGDEPGTCTALTGTPYASADQYNNYCGPEEANMAAARTRKKPGRPGAVMTGQQPGITDKMTGASKGVCEDVSGTPYVGADQFAEACPATAAEPGSPDFPQTMEDTPWGEFSVTSPSGGAQHNGKMSSVTGSQYEQGNITGPFGMADGKITGTEEARFGNHQGNPRRSNGVSAMPEPSTADTVEGRIKSRITGEGMDAGVRITGDDWDRGDNVTGTEGTSAVKRNPTMRVMNGIPAAEMKNAKRNEELPEPVSKVTGGSGNTEKGALITYSGGARG